MDSAGADRRSCCSDKIARTTGRSAIWSKKGFKDASARSAAVHSLDGTKRNTDSNLKN